MGGGRSNAIDPNTMNYATGADTMISPAHLTELGAGRRKLSKYLSLLQCSHFRLQRLCCRSSTESLVKRLERIEQGIARAKAIKQGVQIPPATTSAAATTSIAAAVTAAPAAASPASLAPSDGSSQFHRKITHGRCTLCRSNDNSQSPRQLGAAPLGQVWFSGQKFAAICSRNGIPHFTSLGEQWIYSRTGLWPHFRNDDAFAFRETDHVPSAASALQSLKGPAKQAEIQKLPERWITQALLDTFIASDFRLVFPVVERELFEETIRVAYGAPVTDATIEEIGSKACVLAFLCVTSHHFATQDAAKLVDSDACAKQAQLLISDFVEDASLTTLQVMVMLVSPR